MAWSDSTVSRQAFRHTPQSSIWNVHVTLFLMIKYQWICHDGSIFGTIIAYCRCRVRPVVITLDLDGAYHLMHSMQGSRSAHQILSFWAVTPNYGKWRGLRKEGHLFSQTAVRVTIRCGKPKSEHHWQWRYHKPYISTPHELLQPH